MRWQGRPRLFLHSNCDEINITGIIKIEREAYFDPTAFDPIHDHYDPKSVLDIPPDS
jgi:predicted RNA-binding protein with PUA-like domain